MLYAGTVWLKMDEETFWRTTPRKLFALINVHMQMWQAQWGNGKGSERATEATQTAYIDKINW